MIQRMLALYARYESAHLTLSVKGRPILDQIGERVGHVDSMRLHGGRLQVVGWVLAQKVRLVLAGAETEITPMLRRPDVATALGLPEAVGFDLALPARLQDLRASEAPALVLNAEPGRPGIDPVILPVPFPSQARWCVGTAFLRDLTMALPWVVGWFLTKDPVYRARIKTRLRLNMQLSAGPLSARLLPAPTETGPPGAAPAEGIPTSTALAATGPGITIVLPVYNGFELLDECLSRVETNTDLPWRLILIEDGSSDTRVLPFLRDWVQARDPAQVKLLENPENMGFIRSVNRGFALAMSAAGPEVGGGEGPIVLLNSDAFVPRLWASRLIRPLLSGEDVASVTPMSNDAEIFSVPAICTRTQLLPGQGDIIDATARRFAPDALLTEAPTGVGYCMAMSRDWLARVPEFDTSFGRGYGEEVDWCNKVARLGAVHLGLPGLFVEHRGGESFGSAEKLALVARNNEIVARRYPGYDQSVQDFISADPLRTARLALGLAWAGSLDPDRAVPVYLAHALGGGADHYLEHRLHADLEAGRPTVVLRVGGPRRWQLELICREGRTHGQSDDSELIRRLLAILPRRRVVYSCGVGDPDPIEIPQMLLSLLQPGDDAEMMFHDYFPLSPAYTLLDSDGHYRGPVTLPRADAAHHTRRPDGTLVPLEAWQAAWEQLAQRAELVTFSQDSAEQVAAVWPHLSENITQRPHRLRHSVPRLPDPAPDSPVVVGVLGNIGLQKGAAVVQGLAGRLDQRNAGARLVLIGNIDPAFSLPGSARVHGSYAVDDLPQLVARYGITHWLIPSIWPETFCYTVHECLATGLPTLAFGIGAHGDAVRTAANGIVMPFDLESDLSQTVLISLARRELCQRNESKEKRDTQS